MDDDKVRPIVAGIGNLNLDIVVIDENNFVLCKYGLVANSQLELPYETLVGIIEEAKKKNYHFTYNAGGCTQNSLKLFHEITKPCFESVMFGAIGDDNNGKVLLQMIQNTGIVPQYVEISGHKTTSVLILAFEQSRTAIAHVDAAALFTVDRLLTVERGRLIEAEIILFEGYFALNRSDVYNYVMNNYRDKMILFNIAGRYVFSETSNADDIVDLCLKSDIVVGNRMEFLALADKTGLILPSDEPKDDDDNLTDFMKKFHKSMLRRCKDKKKITGRMATNRDTWKWSKLLIVTNECYPIHYIAYDNLVCCENVYPVNNVIDPTGAGDAFIAGLLYGLFNNRDIRTSICIGCKMGAEIVKQPGINLSIDSFSIDEWLKRE